MPTGRHIFGSFNEAEEEDNRETQALHPHGQRHLQVVTLKQTNKQN